MNRKYTAIAVFVVALLVVYVMPSCKYFNKSKDTEAVKKDSTTTTLTRPSNTIILPHADTSLIPILGKILDDAFAASAKKDYQTMGSYIVYIGPDQKRIAQDVFNAKNKYERGVLKVTSDVFNTWNNNVTSHDYSRVFDMDAAGGMKKMTVLEVIFVSPKNINRKFFGFIKLKDEISYLI